MKEEIEKRRAEAAERKKQMEEDDSAKPTFAISPKGSSKVSFEGSCICAEPDHNIFPSTKSAQPINTHHANVHCKKD